MKFKALKIPYCKECPHCGFNEFVGSFCAIKGDKKDHPSGKAVHVQRPIDDVMEFPKWCPLPDFIDVNEVSISPRRD